MPLGKGHKNGTRDGKASDYVEGMENALTKNHTKAQAEMTVGRYVAK
jgi:hypothetical protein